MLVYITRKNGSFFPDYGRVLHDQSIEGVKPEGKVKVKWMPEQTITFPDGEVCKLTYPVYKIVDWYTDGRHNYGTSTPEAVKPEDLIISVRQPLRHVGMGQMMALDPVEIEALAAKSNYPEYGISGRCNYVKEKGKLGLGLSGNKAQHQDLTVELGFSSDMGVTNSRYPEEICEGQLQMSQGSMMGLFYDQLDVSTEEMENVDLYLHGLGVPARRLGSETKMVQYGDKQISERELVSIGEKCSIKPSATCVTSPRFIHARAELLCSMVCICLGSVVRPSILTLTICSTIWVPKSWALALTITIAADWLEEMNGVPLLFGESVYSIRSMVIPISSTTDVLATS